MTITTILIMTFDIRMLLKSEAGLNNYDDDLDDNNEYDDDYDNDDDI